jgi:hypothetical protein
MGIPGSRVEPQRLSAASWAPFGWLPVEDTDPRDGEHRLEFEWDDVHLNIIGHDRAEVPSVDGGLRCEMLFRHRTHTQALAVLDHTAVIAVAPAGSTFVRSGDEAVVQAFLLEPLEPLVLHRGTWHWGPFPCRAPRVRLLNVQGLRYAEDNTMVDLAALGLDVEVDLSG